MPAQLAPLPARPGLDDLDALNAQLEGWTPPRILRWAWDSFGPDVAVSSSFQSQSVPLLHMIGEAAPSLPVLFLDTGFHFPETLAFRDRLTRELGLNTVVLTPRAGHRGFLRQYGQLYRHDPDLCCHLNKVEPMERALDGQRAWISGIRRDQSAQRAGTPIVQRMAGGLFKICPLATWRGRDVWAYAHRHQLPGHPLLGQGYLSVGCAPCTRAVGEGEDERAGRWAGAAKTECGLHTELGATAARDPADAEESR